MTSFLSFRPQLNPWITLHTELQGPRDFLYNRQTLSAPSVGLTFDLLTDLKLLVAYGT